MIIDIQKAFNASFYESITKGVASNSFGVNIQKLVDSSFVSNDIMSIFKACDINVLKSDVILKCLEELNSVIENRSVIRINSPYKYFSLICKNKISDIVRDRSGSNPKHDIYGNSLLIKRSGLTSVPSEYVKMKYISDYEDN